MAPALRLLPLLLLLGLAAPPEARPLRPKQLWLYYPTNLQVAANVDTLDGVWRRAAKAGYTHVLLSDVKLSRLNDLGGMEKVYGANLARVKKLAAELHLTLVPTVADFGYSGALLWHDPMLAEVVPVRGTLMEARGGVAVLVPDPQVALGKTKFVDESVVLKGSTATVSDPAGNARFTFPLKVSPFRCYHLSVSIETENFSGTPEIKVIDKAGRSLQFQSLGVKSTQGATVHHVVFNPLGAESVTVYFGVWGGGKGKLVWRDWAVEEAPPVNVVRRAGTEVVIRGEGRGEGREVVEGKDVDVIRDPLCGTRPWAGEFDSWHTPPTLRTRLPDGTRFRVDWYYAPLIHDNQVTLCPGEPKTWEIVGRQMREVRAAVATRSLFMGFDEIRVLGWDRACGGAGSGATTAPTPGRTLATAVTRAAGLARDAGASDVYVWSDMFDPFHNAVAPSPNPYYLVNGDLSHAWDGVPKDVVVVNWNFDKRAESLQFFAGRGHRQLVAAYYDGPLDHTRQWLTSAAEVSGVEGIIYCTWKHNYADLEAFAKVCGR